jgi:hypothetical protein
MPKKQVVTATLLIWIAVLFVATACDNGVKIGDLQTESQTVELDDADAVDVEIQMGAGELDVSGGASELLEASFTYNVAELSPQATYADGRLVVKDGGVTARLSSLPDLAKFRNEWDLKLNEDVPMEMKIGLGAGRSNLVLGSLTLTSLNINGGAGEVTIDLTGAGQHDLDAKITGGLGDITLRLPTDVGVIIEVDTVIGGVNAGDFTRDGHTYTSDAYGLSDVTLRIDIDGGVGQINLNLE